MAKKIFSRSIRAYLICDKYNNIYNLFILFCIVTMGIMIYSDEGIKP